ncbi:MAG: hypothetical protein QOE01_253 [Actinomycetota bacterium]|jgi:ubiquinone/menaquinone biosynthesis C-methylase UbiE|nr:hypothetical protein [Actinomycetota bacterium]
MTTDAPEILTQMKAGARAMWSAGDFPAIAQRYLWPVGERLVRRVGIGAGEQVVDVACGTGNAAIRAAEAGGVVRGIDITPRLLEEGRHLAEKAGVTVEWIEGDAEDLPVPDESADVVLSTFGVMFAPRHRVAAVELARVLRPGGRLGICSWTPEGLQGEFFRILGAYMPPAPSFAQPPLLWGNEQHVRELFAGTGVQLEFEREMATEEPRFHSGIEALEFNSTTFGPLMAVRAELERRGEWPAVRDRLAALYETGSEAEYLVALGRKT